MWLISILIAQSAGLIGSIFTRKSVATWYLNINKPTWNPPSFVFGPVWLTLYTLIGLASYLIWQQRSQQSVKPALAIYAIHLILNALWSIFFFGLQNPKLAFIEILILLFFILLTMIMFYKIKPAAFYLMLPYLFWVSFASFLNFTIWRLNS